MLLDNNELARREFAHIDSLYFNTAYLGPSPIRAKQKTNNALNKEMNPSFYPYNNWVGVSDKMRRQLGLLLDAPADNIAHSTSVTDINNLIAHSFPFQKGDVITCIQGDYPSNVLTWLRTQELEGTQVHFIEGRFTGTEDFIKKIPRETRLLNISHVSFDTGRTVDLIPLGKFCQANNIFLIVDTTQSLGGRKITQEELHYIDVLSCSSYKWILGAYGHAFAYYSNRALELLKRKNSNWLVSKNSKNVADLTNYTLETLPGARCFDRGQTPNMMNMSVLEAGLEVIREIGLEKIQQHNTGLRDLFLDHFPKKKYELVSIPETLSNIVAMKTKTIDPIALERELKHHMVDISVRQGNLRLSFHLFNTQDQVERLLEVLDS